MTSPFAASPSFGILGAGGIGQAFARQLIRGGHKVALCNRRGPDSLRALLHELGPNARAVSRHEAAAADIVVLAVPWTQVPAALADVPPWDGRIVIDATNPVLAPDYRLADLGGRTSSEVVSDLVPGARVVKVGNTLAPALLAADPHTAGGQRVLFMSGDHGAAKARVTRILELLGFAIIDLGPLGEGGVLQQFPGGPLPTLDLVKMP